MIQEVLPDIPRLWTALAEWGACLIYMLAVWRPQDSWRRAVAVMVISLPLLGWYHSIVENLPTSLWLLGMMGAVTGMWTILHLALNGSVRRSTYLVVRAFVVAELVASLEWQLDVYFLDHPLGPVSVILLLVVDGVLLTAIYLVERRQFRTEVSPAPVTVVGSAAIAAITFAMSNLSFLSTATPFSGRLGAEVFYIRTLVDLCGFVLLYAQRETDLQVRAARELATTETLLRSQYEQYLTSKRAMDIVNRKYHDLRNLITAIRAEEDPAVRRDQLGELEDSVRPYGAFTRTGSPVLDVLLTDKGQACLERGVTMRVIADGATLGFISTMDLATIVGNAFDNALEAAARVSLPEERWIRLDVRPRRGFVLLEIENATATIPVIAADGETLLTTKADSDLHGFGLTSIRRTVEDYDGEVTAGVTEQGTFLLRVLLPVPAGFVPERSVEGEDTAGDPVARHR